MTFLTFLSYVTYAISVGAALYFVYCLGVLAKEKWSELKTEVDEQERIEQAAELLATLNRLNGEDEKAA